MIVNIYYLASNFLPEKPESTRLRSARKQISNKINIYDHDHDQFEAFSTEKRPIRSKLSTHQMF